MSVPLGRLKNDEWDWLLGNMNKNLTACCGLCCADCIPSNRELFLLVERLEKMLGELKFEVYAEYKAKQIPDFNDYPLFLSVLRRIGQLHCSTCRQGGGNARCEIRPCVQDHGLHGCWECDRRPGCNRLEHLREAHPNLDQNLDLIAQMGPEKWFEKRKGHYRWQLDK